MGDAFWPPAAQLASPLWVFFQRQRRVLFEECVAGSAADSHCDLPRPEMVCSSVENCDARCNEQRLEGVSTDETEGSRRRHKASCLVEKWRSSANSAEGGGQNQKV